MEKDLRFLDSKIALLINHKITVEVRGGGVGGAGEWMWRGRSWGVRRVHIEGKGCGGGGAGEWVWRGGAGE